MHIEELRQGLCRLIPLARAQAMEADRAADLNKEVVGALQELGLFKLWVPKTCGGFELDLPQTLRLYETAGTIDGSVGWAVMIGTGGGLFAAYLEPRVAMQLFAPAGAVVAGSGAPNGRAERVPNGYRATGRWAYASGASYATIFTANCIVTSGGMPVLDSYGKPVIRAMCFAPADVTVIPTWKATGMRGTGSHDFEVHATFVPEDHTFSVFTDAAREPGPLYRLPFEVLTQLPVAAVASGISRHALDAFAALAVNKVGSRNDIPLGEGESVRSQYARSHARWLSVHFALHALASRTWETVVSGNSLTAQELAEIAASCAFFVSELQSGVAGIAGLAGMNAVRHDSPLARAWCDLQTLAAHASVSPLVYGQAGTALLPAAALHWPG